MLEKALCDSNTHELFNKSIKHVLEYEYKTKLQFLVKKR